MKQKKGIRLVILSHLVKEDELVMQISTCFEFQISNFQGQGQRNVLRDPSQRSGLRDQDQENAHQGRLKGRTQEKGVIGHDLDLKSSWTLPTGLTDLKRPRPG